MKVVLYTMQGCPSCEALKQYLADRNVPFEPHEINDRDARIAFYDRELPSGAERTMPQLFLVFEDGQRGRIGGFEKSLAAGIPARYRRWMGTASAA